MSGAADLPPAAGPAVEADTAPRESRRVFFALWPDDETRKRVARATKDAVRRSGGRPIAKERLHVTVAFLGGLTPAGLTIASTVPPVVVGPFTLTLDTIGAFDSTLWLGARSVPTPLAELERRLWEALEGRGFVREPRIYRPHLTLARRARRVDAEVEPVEWPVAELALVESLPAGRNVHYEVLRTWPL
jgi:2'-5' RNA ligase